MPKAKDKKKKEKLPPRNCKGCGILFTPDTRKQKYHNAKCREEHYNRTYFRNEPKRKTCKGCGSPFTTTKPGRQDYCTPECRIEHSKNERDKVVNAVQEHRHEALGERYKQLEADGFACRLCGKTVRDGVSLDVERDGRGNSMTICNLCSEGRRVKNETP